MAPGVLVGTMHFQVPSPSLPASGSVSRTCDAFAPELARRLLPGTLFAAIVSVVGVSRMTIVTAFARGTSVVQVIHQGVHCVAVEVVPSPVVACGHTGIGMSCCYLHVPQRNAGIKTSSYECTAQ